MPELPEVEHVRRGLQGLGLVSAVRSVWRSHYNLRTGAVWSREQEFTARLRRATPREVGRRGKYLLWAFDSPAVSRPQRVALIHLGMTGHIRTPGARRLKLAADSEAVDQEWPPRFAKLELVFTSQ